MENVILKEIKVERNRCEYVFTIPQALACYIADPNQALFVELPKEYDLKDVPKALLAVPFVGSMMCATMLLNIGIEVPQLDKNFYNCITNVANVYQKMFPYAEFCFDVKVNQLVDCSYETINTPAVFFTGGLDATSALIEHIDEKPMLVNIWGGDVLLSDTDANKVLNQYFTKLTKQIGNEFVFLKSNCRRYFNEVKLEQEVLNRIIKTEHNHGWWASIAHILSMTTVIAPMLYVKRIGHHYVGSSYAANSFGFDANNKEMNDAIKYASANFDIVDDKLERPDKAKKIIQYCESHNLEVEFKVCWYSKASVNCSHCEKCYRTMLNILNNHADPNNYGFKIDAKGYKKMHRFVLYNRVNDAYWEANRKIFLEDADYWRKDKNMSWILDIDFNNERRIALCNCYRRIKGLLTRIKHKIIGG